jgi:hypothetical protein
MTQEVRNVATPASAAKAAVIPATVTTPPPKAPKARVLGANLRLEGEDRRRLIAEAAYFRAERRGFQPGQELEDWLAAEIEVDTLLGEDDGRA